jgi:hypothetical protein
MFFEIRYHLGFLTLAVVEVVLYFTQWELLAPWQEGILTGIFYYIQ